VKWFLEFTVRVIATVRDLETIRTLAGQVRAAIPEAHLSRNRATQNVPLDGSPSTFFRRERTAI